MTKHIPKTLETSLHLDANYQNFVQDIKKHLHRSQMQAALASNQALIQFYWKVGKELSEKQNIYQWGEKFLEQFSHDMRNAFPEMQGFSISNLKRMRLFFENYPDLEISAQAVRQLPWGHIIVLIQKVKDSTARNWYIHQTIENGWSRFMLETQIKSNLYERQGKPSQKLNNFQQHLPEPQSELAHEVLKDPYKFDFLTIQGPAHERAIEDGLIAHIRDFLLELGQGFSFVGSQVPLTFDNQEFFVDLLFYHLKLRCFVVIELKAKEFKPEHTGQLGFYLEAVDTQLRHIDDNQSIGIILCESKNKVIAEYALRTSKMPMGISEYELSNALPEKIKTNLPSLEEIEEELNKLSKNNQ